MTTVDTVNERSRFFGERTRGYLRYDGVVRIAWVALVAACGFQPGPAAQTHDAASGSAASDGPDLQPLDANAGVDAQQFLDAPIVTQLGYVQGKSTTASTSDNVSLQFSNFQTTGDFNVVIVSWLNNASIGQVTDTGGNTYTKVGEASGSFSQGAQTTTVKMAAYYAPTIIGGQKTQVTVQFMSDADTPDLRIAEYSGVAAVSPLDTWGWLRGTGIGATSGIFSTQNAHDLLLAANRVGSYTTFYDGHYTYRSSLSPSGNLSEDRFVTSANQYFALGWQKSDSWWVMLVLAFKAAN